MSIENLKTWHETVFQPWAQQNRAYVQEKTQARKLLVQHASALKHMVGLLFDGKYDEVVKSWNQLGLIPQLKHVRLDAYNERLNLIPTTGQPIVLDLPELLAELEEILKQAR
jgi:hypothetical protein